MIAATTTANSGENRGRVQNLRPWQKGQSGNPLGRPKKTLITDALRAKLAEIDPEDPLGRTNAEIIADRMIGRAKKRERGHQDAVEIADRTEGKAMQKVDVVADFNTTNMTKEQIDERIFQLLAQARARAASQITKP